MGVHENHCCVHCYGCKYGDSDCPVVTGITKQLYPCENCPVTMEAKINPPVMKTSDYGVDQGKKHPLRYLSVEEATEQLRRGHIPDAEDIRILVSYLEEFKALREFAYAVRDARHHLPRRGSY